MNNSKGYVQSISSGVKGGAGVLTEEAWGGKTPGMGCHHHYSEQLEDAAYRECFGPTSGPEETFVKKIKEWFNEAEKDTNQVLTV